MLGLGGLAKGVAGRVAGRREVKPTTAIETARAEVGDSTLFDRFAADALEECPAGGCMRSTEVRQRFHAWCETKGERPPPEKGLWAFMKSRFPHETNNNRPRYLGIRPKRAAPALSVVPSAA